MSFAAFALHASDGSPLTGAAPTFAAYKDRAGASRTPPVIAEIGAGLYDFSPSASDLTAGVAWLVTAPTSAELYLSGTVGSADLAAFAVYDATGAPLASDTPTFAAYKNAGGSDLTQPSIVNLGAGLYGFVPAAGELTDGAAFEIVTAGYPARLSGTVDQFTAPAPALAMRDVAADVAAYLAGAGLGLTLGTNLFSGIEIADYVHEGGDPAVYVNASGGPMPRPYLGTGRSWVVALCTVLVRGVRGTKQAGQTLSLAIASKLQLAPIAGYVFVGLHDAGPNYLGLDDHGAPGWSVGVECRYTL